MTANRTDGGPAYPVSMDHPDINASGMSLLDYFAGQALAGLVNSNSWSMDRDAVAEKAYKFAQSMIDQKAKLQRGE